MANKILKGVMRWLQGGKVIQENITTEIAVPEEYFGATRKLDNLNIGSEADDGKALVKDGAKVKLVDLPTGGGGELTERQKEIIETAGQYGAPIWDGNTQYIAGALVSTTQEVETKIHIGGAAGDQVIKSTKLRFWQCGVDNKGFNPVDVENQPIDPKPWIEVDFKGTFILPSKIEITLGEGK